MRRLSVPVVLLLLVAACDRQADVTTTVITTPTTAPTTTFATTTTIPGTFVIPAELVLQPFADFTAIPLLGDDIPYPGPPTPTSLEGVQIPASGEVHLADPGVVAKLTANGFVVVPDEWRLFHHRYESLDYHREPVFVTTDAAYHAWHQVFDKILRDAEQNMLLPALERLVSGLVDRARIQRDQLATTGLADDADRVAQFYEAVATVLGLEVGPIGPLAEEEVALVTAHEAVATSPTVGVVPCDGDSPSCIFYALYRPRGHYTRSPDLERYFSAMSMLGQTPFPLDPASSRLGMLASRVLLNDRVAIDHWQVLYETTAFLVGAADDYTPFELATAAEKVKAGGLNDAAFLADSDAVAATIAGMERSRPVQINPEKASTRIMGTRFVLDSYIIDQLVTPAVPNRFVTSALDVAAAFGSGWASGTITATGLADYAGYPEQLEAMQDLVAGREPAEWGRTVYDAWLYALEPMWKPHGVAFPDFMRTGAWAAKAHQTGFGSYAELKHDTILYTKQSVAEGGDDEPPPPPPRHWVEPDPVAFLRLGAAATLLGQGLERRGLLEERFASILDSYGEWVSELARIAADELRGRPLSDEDNEFLGTTGFLLESLWLNTSDLDVGGEDAGPDEDAALVADVMTSATEGALEVATGKIDTIYVLVPGFAGFEVAVGGVYSYYEFWQDPNSRLTDEEWRAMLDGGAAPPRPAWQEQFLPGGG